MPGCVPAPAAPDTAATPCTPFCRYRYCQLPPPGYDKPAAAALAASSSQPSAVNLMGHAPSSTALAGQQAPGGVAAKEVGLTSLHEA